MLPINLKLTSGNCNFYKRAGNISIFSLFDSVIWDAKGTWRLHRVFSRRESITMVYSKNFIVVLLVLSAVNLCLARPRWIWLDKEKKNDGNDWSNGISTRETKKSCDHMPVCPPSNGWLAKLLLRQCKNRVPKDRAWYIRLTSLNN